MTFHGTDSGADSSSTERRRHAAIHAAREFESATGIRCALIDPQGRVLYPISAGEYPCRICRDVSGDGAVDGSAAEHAERARQASFSGGRQVFLCRSNLIHCVAPVMDGASVAAALVCGPMRLEEGDSSFQQDVMGLLRRRSEFSAREEGERLRRIYDSIPRVRSARVHALAEQLYRTACSLETLGEEESRDERFARESRINEYIQELKQYRLEHGMEAAVPSYPLRTEQALFNAIAAGETARAQALLNELLGHVFFSFGADLERVRMRAREIVILLSRILISRGADPNRVFGLNYEALDELEGLGEVNEIAPWMAGIVRSFSSSVLRLPANAVHTTILRRAVDYVADSYRGRVSLSIAAALAGVSPSYLSRVFSQEMGETFSRYVRRIRVQRAEELLTGTDLSIAEIAEACGFADQSHLTQAFRRDTGTTPAAYRARR